MQQPKVSIDAEAVSRLAYASTWDIAEISKRLSDPRNPILGARRLLRHYRDFVKWDPDTMISVADIARCS